MKGIILKVDQSKATPDIAILIGNRRIPIPLITYIATAASKIGNTQYPKTQTHWKNEICPPNNLVLMVTTKAPPHIIKNKIPKDFPLSCVSIPKFSTLHYKKSYKESKRQNISGPHKSPTSHKCLQFLNYLTA